MSFSKWEKHLVKCPGCGKDVLDHMTECPFCHEELEPGLRAADPEKLKRTKLIVNIVMYSVAALLLVYYLLRHFGALG